MRPASVSMAGQVQNSSSRLVSLEGVSCSHEGAQEVHHVTSVEEAFDTPPLMIKGEVRCQRKP